MVMKCKKNYYDILGVTPDSDNSEVKTSYRHLARKLHPDVNKDPDSVQKFKDVLEAYETLSDENKRKQYDMLNGFYKRPKPNFSKINNDNLNKDYKTNFKNNKAEECDTFEFSKSKQKTEKSKEPQPQEDVYRKKNTSHEAYSNTFFRKHVNSILDEISKNHKERSQNRLPKDGDDIYTVISITFSESVSGTERLLNIMHKELCPHCNGRKFINGQKCVKCGGSGVFEQRRKITVKVPAGIKDNSKLRLQGEGNPGFFGGKNGNLYINVLIEPDKNMKLDGNNILYNLPISPFEAVLGGEIEVPSFDGKIKFVLPAMTNSGQQFRIARKGLKTNGNVGDMIITVEIQLPSTLTDEEIGMYTKLKKMSKSSVRELD